MGKEVSFSFESLELKIAKKEVSFELMFDKIKLVKGLIGCLEDGVKNIYIIGGLGYFSNLFKDMVYVEYVGINDSNIIGNAFGATFVEKEEIEDDIIIFTTNEDLI